LSSFLGGFVRVFFVALITDHGGEEAQSQESMDKKKARVENLNFVGVLGQA